jgi:tRNA dimethylallyltransferase
LPATERFDAQRYAETARAIVADIHRRNKIALVVGGTGLYFRALIDGFAPTPAVDPARRAELAALDLASLVARLAAADPAAAALVDLKNKRRVTRAIEIVEGSGQPLAPFRETPSILKQTPGLLLVRERGDLRERIAKNVHAMFAAGAVEEVRSLGDRVGPTASRAIGLAEIQALLRDEITRAECVEKIIIATRQYAKRQLTWFRHQTTFRSLDLTDFPHPSDAVETALGATDAA